MGGLIVHTKYPNLLLVLPKSNLMWDVWCKVTYNIDLIDLLGLTISKLINTTVIIIQCLVTLVSQFKSPYGLKNIEAGMYENV